MFVHMNSISRLPTDVNRFFDVFLPKYFQIFLFVYRVFKILVYNIVDMDIFSKKQVIQVMMKDRSFGRSALLYTVIALVLTVASMALRLIGVFCFYDREVGYYSGALIPLLSTILTLGGIVGLAVAARLLLAKAPMAYPRKASLSVKIAAGLAALLFLALAMTDLTGGAPWYTAVLGLGACLYFLLMLTGERIPLAHLVSGLCLIARLILALADSYFNIRIALNSPDKLALHLGLLAGTVFVAGELRALIAKPRTAFWFFSAGCGLLFLGSASLPSIPATLNGQLYEGDDLRLSLALLGFFVYLCVRLISVLLDPTPAEEPQAEEADVSEEASEAEANETDSDETETNETETTETEQQ